MQIFDIEPATKELKQSQVRSFSASFLCCDWSFGDYVVAGAEQGQLLVTKPEDLAQAELKQVSDSDITAVKASDESEHCVAVGTASGQVLFVDTENGEIIFEAFTKQNQNPHSAKVIKITWNPRVPRVCCSLDEKGTAIVWDLKKKGAVMSFQVAGAVDVIFSQEVATILYLLKPKEIDVWDLRQRQDRLKALPLSKEGAIGLRLHEGANNVVGVYYPDQTIVSLDLKSDAEVGKQRLGDQFSYVYPNLWVNVLEDGSIQLHVRAVIVNGKPILFNPALLVRELRDDEDEIIHLPHVPIALSQRNALFNISGDKVLVQQITDSEDVVKQVREGLSATEIAPQCKELLRLLEAPREAIIDELTVERPEKVELEDEEPQAAPESKQNADDFFDENIE